MPERLKRLLGYFVHEPNLGSVNGIDPYEFAILGKKEKEFSEFIPEIFGHIQGIIFLFQGMYGFLTDR